MNDLISRSELEQAMEEELWISDCTKNIISIVLDKLPTVDAVQVVRCKDCKHRDPEDKRCDHPMGGGCPFRRKDTDFCSYGERKVNRCD